MNAEKMSEKIRVMVEELFRLGNLQDAEGVLRVLERGELEKAFHRARWALWKARKGNTSSTAKEGKMRVKKIKEVRDIIEVSDVVLLVESQEYKETVNRIIQAGFDEATAAKMAAAVAPRSQSQVVKQLFLLVHGATIEEITQKALSLLSNL